jgi:hypothetical protein
MGKKGLKLNQVKRRSQAKWLVTIQYLSSVYHLSIYLSSIHLSLSHLLHILFLILSFLHLLTCVYIVWDSSLPPPTTSRQNLFHPLVLWFCWREDISDNKKDIAFLLVWDKDSYTERFLALLPCTCVLQPELIPLYQTASLLSGHLPIVASASLRLLYLLLYNGHINHIQVLGFLPFPYSSSTHSPLSVWPVSNNITAFVLDLLIHIWGRTYDFWPSEPG